MDPREFLYFLRRRFFLITGTLLFAFIISIVYSLQHDGGEKGALIFVTLGMEVSEGMPADSYVTNESHNVIDQFTETVQGWLFNPALLERVNELAEMEISLSVRKQEKQNLLVSVTVPPDGDVALASATVQSVLEEEINNYNEATNTRFVLALSSVTFFENGPQHGLNVFIGLFLGFLFAVTGLLLWEYATRRVSFGFQVASIVGSAPSAHLSRRLTGKDLEDWVSARKRWFGPQAELIFNLSDFEKISKGRSFVFVVRLGETLEDELRDVRQLLGQSFDYILVI